jgi:hypothetical protein
MTPTPDLIDAQLDLYLGLDRLLAEADRVRTLRDRLLAEVRQATRPESASRSPRYAPPEEARHA